MKDDNNYNRRGFIETVSQVAAGFYVLPLFSYCNSVTSPPHPKVGTTVNRMSRYLVFATWNVHGPGNAL